MITTIESGLRWSKNIVTELSQNYSRKLPPKVREALLRALSGLSDAVYALNEYENELSRGNNAPSSVKEGGGNDAKETLDPSS